MWSRSASKDGLGQARIAFHLSLWPLLVFISLFGLSFLLLVAVALDGESLRSAVEPFLTILIFQVINNPLLGFLLMFSFFGIAMGIGIRAGKVGEITDRSTTKAVLLGLAGFAVYALLVWFWSGFGR